jgi:hypothetical protein
MGTYPPFIYFRLKIFSKFSLCILYELMGLAFMSQTWRIIKIMRFDNY